jgi:glycosyltransferase involved in cell wall biosynthesis
VWERILLKITFAHHLSLSYGAGGEKWIINTAKELSKEYDVEVYALPFLLDGKRRITPQKELGDIPYHEGFYHNITSDVCYVTYNPLSFLNFNIKGPKIAGLHSEAYWQKPNLRYGKYPLVANIVNRFVSYGELRRFDAVHCLNNVYPVNHPVVYTIPDFVDSRRYKPSLKEDVFTAAFASRKVWQKGYDIWQSVKSKLPRDMSFVESGDILEEYMPTFLGMNHAVVAPSRVETFGLSIVEAALCGTPVLTSNTPVHRQLDLPLILCSSIQDYVDYLSQLSDQWYHRRGDYDFYTAKLRQAALQFNRENVVHRLEDMFLEVAYCADT